jgi:Flp pilus assembly protein TadD
MRDRIRRVRIRSEAEGYLELGMAQHALDSLGRLGDPAGFDAESLYLWGEGLRAQERYYEALMPLERAVKVIPQDIRVRMALSWCYKRTGRLDLAIASTEEALRITPTEAVLHYNLACYLSLAGEKCRALRLLNEALTMDPDFGELIDEESDFDPLRSDPEFQKICDRWKE